MSHRETLAKPQPKRRAPTTTTWMAEHLEAQTFVDAWLVMVKEGSTDWSQRHVWKYLAAEFGYPFTRSAFQDWLARRQTT